MMTTEVPPDEFQRALDGELTDIGKFLLARKFALQGDTEAIEYLVEAYQKGRGVEPDQVRAFEWMSKAATQLKMAKFYVDLALAYFDGTGTSRDIEKFWDWMTRAADNEDPEAMFHLADAHRKPSLGRLDIKRSAEWTARMADLGAPGAIIQLAHLYRDGVGVEKDLVRFKEQSARAVQAAKLVWDKVLHAGANYYQDSWTYEDYPEALTILAEANKLTGDNFLARKHYVEAALAADQSMQLAIDSRDEAGQRLVEIMAARLQYFRTNATREVRLKDRSNYFRWLEKINIAIEYCESTDVKPPRSFSNALYDLALAHRDGTGTVKSKKKYEHYLEKAAAMEHADAAYTLALKALKKKDILTFNQYIEIAISSNHPVAAIAQATAAVGLTKAKFLTVLDSFQKLRHAVNDIRKAHHEVAATDAQRGVAHYTDAFALSSMLGNSSTPANNVIRLYNIAYVNDPKEGKRLRSFEPENYENPLKELFDETNEQEAIHWQGKDYLVFVACFSLACNTLNLWRFYGRDGAGYCVVSPLVAFDADSTNSLLQGSWSRESSESREVTLHKVLYSDDAVQTALDALSQPMKDVRESMKGLNSATRKKLMAIPRVIISELLFLYKDRHYEHEREVRAVEARALDDPALKLHPMGSTPFAKLYIETKALLFQLPGSQIFIGPKVADPTATTLDIKHRLALRGWNNCEVSQSGVTYR